MVWCEGSRVQDLKVLLGMHPAWSAPISFSPLAQCLDLGSHRPGSSSAVALPHCNEPPARVLPGCCQVELRDVIGKPFAHSKPAAWLLVHCALWDFTGTSPPPKIRLICACSN